MARTLLFYSVCFQFAAVLMVSVGFANESVSLEELMSLSKIRVVIYEAPNNGHQSMGAVVVSRLRELGYQGHIEVIYDSSAKAKLEYLMPPFLQDGSDMQNYPDLNLSFRKMNLNGLTQTHELYNLETLPFGIAGAVDFEATPPQTLKVETLLTIQPYDWRIGPSFSYATDEYDRYIKEGLDVIKHMGFSYALPNLEQMPEIIQGDMSSGPHISKKIPGLLSMIQNLDSYDLAPIYAHGLVALGSSQLYVYVRSIALAKQKRPDLFRRAVVIPVLNNQLGSQRADLLESIERFDDVKDQIIVKDIQDSDLPSALQSLPKEKVLVVQVGHIARRVFEGLYAASSIPPVVKGMNSMNLMRMIGRPYLTSVEEEPLPFATSAITGRADSAFRLMYENHFINDFKDWDRRMTDSGMLRFLIEAMEPHSAVQREFAENMQSSTHAQEDRILQALKHANDKLKSLKAEGWVQRQWRNSGALENCDKFWGS